MKRAKNLLLFSHSFCLAFELKNNRANKSGKKQWIYIIEWTVSYRCVGSNNGCRDRIDVKCKCILILNAKQIFDSEVWCLMFNVINLWFEYLDWQKKKTNNKFMQNFRWLWFNPFFVFSISNTVYYFETNIPMYTYILMSQNNPSYCCQSKFHGSISFEDEIKNNQYFHFPLIKTLSCLLKWESYK